MTSKLAREANGIEKIKRRKEIKCASLGGRPLALTLTDRQSERKDGDSLTQPQPLSLGFSIFKHRNKQRPGFDTLTTERSEPPAHIKEMFLASGSGISSAAYHFVGATSTDIFNGTLV